MTEPKFEPAAEESQMSPYELQAQTSEANPEEIIVNIGPNNGYVNVRMDGDTLVVEHFNYEGDIVESLESKVIVNPTPEL